MTQGTQHTKDGYICHPEMFIENNAVQLIEQRYLINERKRRGDKV